MPKRENGIYHLAIRWTPVEADTEALSDHGDDPVSFHEEHGDTILESLKTAGCDRYIYQLERGDDTHRLHYQVYAHLKVKK